MTMKNLKEMVDYQVSLALCEAKSGFDMRVFKTLETSYDMTDYARQHKLQRLGQGSSRIAFLLNSRFVLKIAHDKQRGPAQNEVEVSVYTNPTTKPVVAKIYDFDPSYRWIVSESVRELRRNSEFEPLTGIDFDLFRRALNDIDLQSELEYEQEKIQDYSPDTFDYNYHKYEIKKLEEIIKTVNDPFVKSVRSLVDQNQLEIADIGVINHWGKTANGRVVLLDYGFDQAVANRYYS